MTRSLIICSALLLGGCYAEGGSYFLSAAPREYFLTMDRCEQEAKAKHASGEPKYAGFECRSKFLWFTLEKRDYYGGKPQ